MPDFLLGCIMIMLIFSSLFTLVFEISESKIPKWALLQVVIFILCLFWLDAAWGAMPIVKEEIVTPYLENNTQVYQQRSGDKITVINMNVYYGRIIKPNEKIKVITKDTGWKYGMYVTNQQKSYKLFEE